MNIPGLLTLLKKELMRIKDIWKQSILSPVISNVLFFVVFGVAIADRATSFAGYNYLTVLVPGLVAMGLMMNSLQNPLFSLIISKYTRNIGDLLMLPLSGIELALAYLIGGMVRGLSVAVVTLIVGFFFAPVPFANPLWILIFTMLLGGTFASIGMILGVISSDFEQANAIPTFVISPLIYMGGVFYSIQNLPGFMQTLTKFNPVFYMVDGFRYGFLGVGDASIWLSVTVTSIFFVGFFSIASWIFHTGYKLKT